MTTVLTRIGYEKLKKEYQKLRNEQIPEVLEEMKVAQNENNCAISENSEYLDAASRYERLEKRLEEYQSKLSNVRVVELSELVNDGKIKFGVTVELNNITDNKKMKFQIVGVEESDVKDGKISYQSPLAKEMIGCYSGDFVDCADKEYEILSVDIIKD